MSSPWSKGRRKMDCEMEVVEGQRDMEKSPRVVVRVMLTH